jgi:hypothetical protein
MVVEDDVLLGHDLAWILDDLGCAPLGPFAGRDEALCALHDGPVSAALLDYRILGGTSEPVADALAARAVPFAFVTGNAECVADGPHAAAPQIDKPVPAERIAAFLTALGLVPPPHGRPRRPRGPA